MRLLKEQITNYKLKITNDRTGEEVITKNQIPITQLSYTLTNEEAGKLSTNESYTAVIELVDSTGKVLTSAETTLEYDWLITEGSLGVGSPQIGEGILTNEGLITAAVAIPAITLFGLTGLYALIENKSPLTLLLLLFTTRKHKKGGKVFDKKTYKALALAEVELEGLSGKRVRSKDLTDSYGYYSLKAPEEGKYVVKVTTAGYKEFTEEVELKKGEELHLDVRMERTVMQSKPQIILINLKNGTYRFVTRISKVLLVVGFLLSIYLFIITPSVATAIILIIYGIISIPNLYYVLVSKK